ncbi:MAG: hypothetical protein QOK07_312 [Gemmatimonadaceae bacterium]|nr:hypothetical protein [Gemmatimonadaceae bacterium]
MRFMSALCAVALITPVPAMSQTSALDPARVDAGSRVRIAAPVFGGKKQVATVVSVTDDSLLLRQGASTAYLSVAKSDITGLEVSRGTHTRKGRGALLGLLIGAGTGAAIGAATYKKPKPCEGFSCFGDILGPSSRGFNVGIGAAFGGLLGTAVGALVGMSARDSWVPATVGAK